MAGKSKKSAKSKSSKKEKNSPLTFEEKLSSVKSSMKDITEGKNQRYHLR